MTGYVVIPIVAAAGATLLGLDRWLRPYGGAHLVRNAAIDHHLLYQPLSAGVAVATVLATHLLVPESASYLAVGDLHAPVIGLSWMGAGAGDTWWRVGLTLGLVITVVTATVVWLQATGAGAVDTRHVRPAFLAALPFAAVNAAVEEVIFRLALCDALGAVAPMMMLAMISGLLFGLPHYFGNPGKIPGVVLAGFLSWLMCLSVLQTRGIAWAWGIHCVQDIVVLTLLFAVAATRVTCGPSSKPAAGSEAQCAVERRL